MWLNHQLSADFHKEYAIEEKTLDVRSDHILEIFKSKKFGQIALIDERELLLECHLGYVSEFIAHIGACCLRVKAPESPQDQALILGGFNLELAFELLKHNMLIHYIQSDSKVLDSLISFLPHFQSVREHRDFGLYAKAIDLPLGKYHLIIHQATPNAHELDGLSRMLHTDGVFIARLPHPYLQADECKQMLSSVSALFSITMPFAMPFFGDEVFVFASKATHPLADLWLQRADMLDNLSFYNADIHNAAFAMPTRLASTLRPWVKN